MTIPAIGDWAIWRAARGDEDRLALMEALAFGGKSWGAESIKASFTAARVTVLFGGRNERQPEGFALWRDLGEEAEILTIGVIPVARGLGLAAALLAAAIEGARQSGAAQMHLEVSDENAAARRLYEKAGFRRVGARKRYYRDGGDATMMALDL